MKKSLIKILAMLVLSIFAVSCTHEAESTGSSSSADITEKEQAVEKLLEEAASEADEDRYYVMEYIISDSLSRASNASCYICVQFPNYFSDEELLKKSIKYGYYEQMLYKDHEGENNGAGRYFLTGKLLTEAAQDIYLGKCTEEDEQTAEKLNELEEQLKFLYDEYYGDNSADIKKELVYNLQL